MEKTELEKRLEAEAAAEAAKKAEAQETVPEESQRDLSAELDAVKAERDQLRDQFLRSRAEFENFRKRKARDEEQFRLRAAKNLVLDLLPVLDHLELAMQHARDESGGLVEGVAMVVKQFREVLARHGVEPVPAAGIAFDPSLHDAVMQREDPSVPNHTVLEEVQRGYMMGGQLIRPARVVVSVGGPPRETTTEQTRTCAEPETTEVTTERIGDESNTELD
ncbi:MAG TPA: nucleotide exchange factor GrpE [Candidatus Hydrogenedentes bacterium]|jgi:molecular chaperone GrpE|nr:nucleotide exchange factor GrpE [Candidatus Hydrogenedentota bacterium]HOL77158.1 nucleotide exchange factor GrpE [Candidatus Hydrogenedentota bacterium]HPO85903.1 nucleotide exchange factor GrpE [Candidatus Hydrogenedentota bacterium]